MRNPNISHKRRGRYPEFLGAALTVTAYAAFTKESCMKLGTGFVVRTELRGFFAHEKDYMENMLTAVSNCTSLQPATMED
jgi:hypothetical protein